MKLGITNSLLLIAALASLANIGDEIGHTSGVSKWAHLTETLPVGLKLTQINWTDFKAEAKDYDAEERAQLEAKFKEVFDIKNDNLEGVIEDGIDVLEGIAMQVVAVEKFVEKVKALKAA